MFSGNNSLPTAALTAREQDLRPLLEESGRELELDNRKAAELETYLHRAWFFGVKTGHKIMVETKMGQTNPAPVVLSMQGEFQELMERCADALNLTVGATLEAWSYLGRAWIAGSQFWEVEMAARMIEQRLGGFDEALRKLEG
jgi:hypothetical protein